MSIRDAGTSLHAASTSSRIQWRGTVTSVQPRIRLTRSFDQRSHSYQGYVLRVSGSIAGETREFLVAVGPAAHTKHQFRAGDSVSGEGTPVAEPRLETAEIYEKTFQNAGKAATLMRMALVRAENRGDDMIADRARAMPALVRSDRRSDSILATQATMDSSSS